MDQLPALGTSIATSVLPTVQLYKSVLAPLAAGFIKPQELTYGPHPRHHLDVFLPPAPEELLPVILFVHGGGFDKGAKRLPHVEGAYQNVGNFFARQGFLSIVLNYRLVGPESDGGARFPSGGEDVAFAINWLAQNQQHGSSHADLSRVFLLGNSAGAVHVATYLFSDALEKTRTTISKSSVIVRAAALVGMPADFASADAVRGSTLTSYYGGDVAQLCPSGLRKSSKDETEVLIATSEFDPDDEILAPNRRFCEVIASLPKPAKWEELKIKGHNHISTPLGLSAGGIEEAWGLQVRDWLLARSAGNKL